MVKTRGGGSTCGGRGRGRGRGRDRDRGGCMQEITEYEKRLAQNPFIEVGRGGHKQQMIEYQKLPRNPFIKLREGGQVSAVRVNSPPITGRCRRGIKEKVRLGSRTI